MDQDLKYGVALLSWNRPSYLNQVLKSLKDQTYQNFDIHLFNDGPPNPLVHSCHQMFRETFPEGELHASETNLGVAFSFKRAEEYMFDRYERVIFIVDDCVPTLFYFEWLHKMAEKFKHDERIGSINGWIGTVQPLEWQEKRKTILRAGNFTMNLVFRKAYEKWYPHMLDYYELTKDEPYGAFDNSGEIYDLYASKGAKSDGTTPPSQDGVKEIAFVLAELVKISLGVNYGHYIGKEGVHSTEAWYYQHEYDKEEVYPKLVTEIEHLTEDDVGLIFDVVYKYRMDPTKVEHWPEAKETVRITRRGLVDGLPPGVNDDIEDAIELHAKDAEERKAALHRLPSFSPLITPTPEAQTGNQFYRSG